MIARSNRFHGHGSLRYLYTKGNTARGNQLTIRYIINNRRKTWRLAVVVSKKVHKSAIVRNRIRRRLYEIIRLNQDRISKPFDIAIIVFSPTIAELEQPKLESLVIDLFEKSEIFDIFTDKKHLNHDKIIKKEV
jgi:ribonuclease P protein component